MMQKIDEGVAEDGRIKHSMENLDVFGAVNQLRNDRANAIEDFGTYQGLIQCLNYYGLNRSALLQKTSTETRGRIRRDLEQKEANGNSSHDSTTSNESDEIEYVLQDDTTEQHNDIFSGYYHD